MIDGSRFIGRKVSSLHAQQLGASRHDCERNFEHLRICHRPSEAIDRMTYEPDVITVISLGLVKPIDGNRGPKDNALAPFHMQAGYGTSPALSLPNIHQVLNSRRVVRRTPGKPAPNSDAQLPSRRLAERHQIGLSMAGFALVRESILLSPISAEGLKRLPLMTGTAAFHLLPSIVNQPTHAGILSELLSLLRGRIQAIAEAAKHGPILPERESISTSRMIR